MENNNYIFKGLRILEKEEKNYIPNYKKIYICPYTIDNTGKFPFIKYLLEKNYLDLDFIQFPIYLSLELNDLIKFSNEYLNNILNKEKDSEKLEIIFEGYIENDEKIFLFFDITKINLQINDIYLSNSLWFTLVDEIVNRKKLCNIPINNNCIDLLIQKEDLCFLLDKNNNNIEIPEVGYVTKEENKLNFTYIFGETRGEFNNIFGPHFYFTTYKEAILEGINKNLNKMGIVRFALFLGYIKFIQNSLEDDQDNSEIKKLKLNNENIDRQLEILTMRITDYDGNWSRDIYDSIYLGNTLLDNESIWNNQMFVVKDFLQQIPLSYHYIDKKQYQEKQNFSIL